MNNSEDFHKPLLDALCAFVREGTKPQAGAIKSMKGVTRDRPADVVAAELPSPDTDIQAAITVIGWRKYKKDSPNLVGITIPMAQLHSAELFGADLQGADLRGANLHRAGLDWSNLHGAKLLRADLRNAGLSGADFRPRTYLDALNLYVETRKSKHILTAEASAPALVEHSLSHRHSQSMFGYLQRFFRFFESFDCVCQCVKRRLDIGAGNHFRQFIDLMGVMADNDHFFAVDQRKSMLAITAVTPIRASAKRIQIIALTFEGAGVNVSMRASDVKF
jgi:uncharacterized protein YjbI with pentapeptide repeats